MCDHTVSTNKRMSIQLKGFVAEAGTMTKADEKRTKKIDGKNSSKMSSTQARRHWRAKKRQ
ncbi:hypothetical protein CAEBREN_15658 [Caenorhabditis brenneri]|uniref:Uncharacterized protein n=1 Tax=Caenorhabditis brenneri TaxID=135651 RepID=G0P2T0_CAEBE|nr:hypothetical protein CAEBREN_15658 [Caenorhabditis brenneri]